MKNRLTSLIEQQFIIHKLKKEASALYKKNPQHTFEECQNQISQEYGWQHWYEFHSFIKNKFPYNSNNTLISHEPNNNFYLGSDKFLGKPNYLKTNFQAIHLKNNINTYNFSCSLVKEIMFKNHSQFIYYKTGQANMLSFSSYIEDYAKEHQIKLYHMSSSSPTTSVYYDLNTISSASLSELFVSCIKRNESVDFWTGRVISFISSLFFSLVWMRNQGEIQLNSNTIRKYLNLEIFSELTNREDFPPHIRSSINIYLKNLISHEIHSYLSQQLIPFLNFMDKYPHLFMATKYSFSLKELVQSQEKYLLIVDFSDFPIDQIDAFLSVNCFFNGIIQANSNIKESDFNYASYLLLENSHFFDIPDGFFLNNQKNENFIILDNDNHSNITCIEPSKENSVIIK